MQHRPSTMLSILIPVYCFDIRPLVQQLWQQAQGLPFSWEIRLLDDASPVHWQSINRELANLPGVEYAEQVENTGRAQIRNTLASSARYEYLLFMDCDSAVPDSKFLERYREHLSPQTVLCGGRIYLDAPAKTNEHLHWWYGSQREVKSAAARQKRPYEGFMTNNYLVPKSVALQIPFDPSLQHYGHEDTLFGLELKRHQINIIHLDNPLLHIGLEDAEKWLNKQHQAIKNLYILHQQHPDLETRALRLWTWLHNSGFLGWLYPLLKRRAPLWRKRLTQATRPSLRLLDGLKIFWLEQMWREENTQ